MTIKLPQVTLFGIDTQSADRLNRAAEICQREIGFGDVRLVTNKIFPDRTRQEAINNYSRFMIKDLAAHFSTSHVLVIQPDGYIQNPDAWDNEWLQYDYIGAPWDFYNENMVGNGGFSLRSFRLCNALATDVKIDDFAPEDDKICRKYRKYLEQVHGIRFAPVEVAKKFSIEAWGLKPEYQKYTNEFGFHGYSVKGLPIPPSHPAMGLNQPFKLRP